MCVRWSNAFETWNSKPSNNHGQRGSFLAEAAPTAHDGDNRAPVNLDYSEPRRSLPVHLTSVEGLNRLSSAAEAASSPPRDVSLSMLPHTR